MNSSSQSNCLANRTWKIMLEAALWNSLWGFMGFPSNRKKDKVITWYHCFQHHVKEIHMQILMSFLKSVGSSKKFSALTSNPHFAPVTLQSNLSLLGFLELSQSNPTKASQLPQNFVSFVLLVICKQQETFRAFEDMFFSVGNMFLNGTN